MASPKAGKTPAPTKKAAKPAAPTKVRAGSVASKSAKPAAKKSPAKNQAPASPTKPTREQQFDIICERLVEGKSLHAICGDESLPSITTVMRWLGEEESGHLREQYARAREAQAEKMAEDILAIADEECTTVRASKHGIDGDADGMREVVFDATAVARNRLRVDARKWLASKLAPKKYGDKVLNEVTGANGGAIAQSITVSFVAAKQPEGDE